MLAPDWAGLHHKDDFGRALMQIAARLAEQTTTRLDKTAFRDKLAFLEALDVEPPPPRSATVPIVFTLADKRDTPVFAPARVRLTAPAATAGEDDISFETREAIVLTPARIMRLIAADPHSDRIEATPALVIGAVDAPVPQTEYRLLGAVETGSKSLQLVQAVGIEEGDLLRMGASVYRAAKPSGAIVPLLDPLESSAAAGARVEKVVRFDTFALRNLREHDAFVGHKEMLKLDAPAQITLVFDPPALAHRLAGLDLEFAMWGTEKDKKDAAWLPLRLLGADGRGLHLVKEWPGSVDEFELPCGKSRWIRIRLRTPIVGACGPDSNAVSIHLRVQSLATSSSPGAGTPAVGGQAAGPLPDDASPEGSPAISAASHNGQPLSTTTAFFPFGPEPQRFDVFALAAPEALSKKGAVVTLGVTVDDAKLDSMTLAFDTTGAAARVYGVSVNGRLQLLDFGPSSGPDWKSLGFADASAGAAEGSIRIDPEIPPAATRIDAVRDRVFVRDMKKRLRAARVIKARAGWTVDEWLDLSSTETNKPFLAFCVIRSATRGDPVRWLLAINADGLHGASIDQAGTLGALKRLNPLPQVPNGPVVVPAVREQPRPALVRAEAASGGGIVALIDSDGYVFRGSVAAAADAVTWKPIPILKGGKALPSVPPAASLDADSLVMVVAQVASDDLLVLREGGAQESIPTETSAGRTGRPVSILRATLDSDPNLRTLTIATGRDGLLVHVQNEAAQVVPLPELVSRDVSPRALLLRRTGDSPDRLTLLLNAATELVLRAPIGGERAIEVRWHHMLGRGKATPAPTHVLIDYVPPYLAKVEDTGISFAGDAKVWTALEPPPDPPGPVTEVRTYTFRLGGGRGSTIAGLTDQVELAADDSYTKQNHRLRIAGSFHKVKKVDKNGPKPIATLDPPLAGTANSTDAVPVDYETFPPRSAAFKNQNIFTLAKPLGSPIPPGVRQIRLPPPVGLRTAQVDSKGAWLRLHEPSSVSPPSPFVELISDAAIGGWKEVRLPREADNPELSWEYFDGAGWRRLDSADVPGQRALTDETANLAKSGAIRFQVPDDLTPTEIGGQEDYWIRARLVGGDYGRPSYVVSSNPPPPEKTVRQSITVDRSRLNPPEILRIEVTYVLNKAIPPDLVATCNNLTWIDQTQAAARNGARFTLFEGVAQHVGDAGGGTRALYIGLGKRPAVAALNLYAAAVDRDEAPRQLIAEALTPAGWRRLASRDPTAALTGSGILRLFLDPPPERLPLFGRDGWWLRLRPAEDAADWAPQLSGLFVNAVDAEHAKSITQEILGSSLGEPRQQYWLAQTPVLPTTVELRVRESLSEEERVELIRHGGEAAVVRDPNLPDEWVRWKQVTTFVDQSGDARVFRLNPATGEILFGNGRSGKIPPAGTDSIRAFSYQQGGGSAGNVPARTIANLSSAIESVELAMNPVDAAGGADAPGPERLAASGPSVLRHVGRALAPADIEALVVESAPDVVRARCLARRGCGIDLVVAIRGTGGRCPKPSRARRDGIAGNILASGWGALAPDSVRVLPPRYVRIEVGLAVRAKSAEAVAGVDQAVRERLTSFLHPVEGGPDGRGWPFGRRVWPSDVQRALADIADLDRVVEVEINAKERGQSLDVMPPDGLVCVEAADIKILVEAPEDGR